MHFIIRNSSRSTGRKYERIAAGYLESLGYEVLELNFKGRHGEIDIIARDKEYLVFIEVKYRSDCTAGYPCEAVDLRKQQRIRHTAMTYLLKHHYIPEQTFCRFDVVSILGDAVSLYKNAF